MRNISAVKKDYDKGDKKIQLYGSRRAEKIKDIDKHVIGQW